MKTFFFIHPVCILTFSVSFSDINECVVSADNIILNDCSMLATCQNLMGSFSCTCNAGYHGDGQVCDGEDDVILLLRENCIIY